MTHTLISLPYAPEALEPVMSSETISFHHGKHHNNYVVTLNKLIEGTEFASASLLEIVLKSDGAIYNNAGQVLNHNLFFEQLAPKAQCEAPSGKILEAINKAFGSFEEFKTQFQQAATSLFGSGWAFLAADKDGNLSIVKEPNAGNPVRKGLNPLLACDVWEHAYYLGYQNRRADYTASLWDIINWKEVERRYLNPLV